MATAKFFDNYSSTLSGSYTAGGVSLSITAAGSGASALPATAGDYYLVVDSGTASEEVFKVTARSTLTLTVVGAQAGTSAANHSSGAEIKGPILTAAAVTQLKDDIAGTVQTLSAFDASGTSFPNGYRVKIIGTPYEAVMVSGAWVYISGENVVTRPSSLSYTWANQSSATVAVTNASVFLDSVVSHASAHNWNLRYIPIPSPSNPYTLICQFKAHFLLVNQANNRAGIGIYDSSSTKFIALDMAVNGSEVSSALAWTNPTTYGGSTYFTTTIQTNLSWDRGYQFMKIVNDGTNVLYYSSYNQGRNWIELFSHAKNTFVTPDSVFFGVSAFANVIQIEVIDFTLTQP